MAKQLTCDCGFQLTTHNEEELVSFAQQHVQKTHNQTITREQVMGMAKEV